MIASMAATYYDRSVVVTTSIVPPVTSPRTRALDAAIDLLAADGLRALTHARVDERAGIPEGSTSNYFRTRAALLAAWPPRSRSTTGRGSAVAFAPSSAAELVDGLLGLFEYLTVVARAQTTARLVLFMEASHDAALREVLNRGREAMEAAVVTALARLGAKDPVAGAAAIAACSEGLILHRIARHDDHDPRPAVELVVTRRPVLRRRRDRPRGYGTRGDVTSQANQV
jgi:DNA-binding transcriptional regulator YbjK